MGSEERRHRSLGNCAIVTYAELIADFWIVWEWFVDGIVRVSWVDCFELGIIFIFRLDSCLQATCAARAVLLLLQELNKSVLVLENASQKVLKV